MITGVIVGASILAGVAFTLAWLAWPRLRARVEGPKYTFLERARQYDRRDGAAPGAK